MVAEAPAALNLTVFLSPSTREVNDAHTAYCIMHWHGNGKENYASGAACTVFPT